MLVNSLTKNSTQPESFSVHPASVTALKQVPWPQYNHSALIVCARTFLSVASENKLSCRNSQTLSLFVEPPALGLKLKSWFCLTKRGAHTRRQERGILFSPNWQLEKFLLAWMHFPASPHQLHGGAPPLCFFYPWMAAWIGVSKDWIQVLHGSFAKFTINFHFLNRFFQISQQTTKKNVRICGSAMTNDPKLPRMHDRSKISQKPTRLQGTAVPLTCFPHGHPV